MSQFNFIERKMARLLGRFPGLKSYAKVVYSRLMFLKNRKSYSFKTDFKVEEVIKGRTSFFGYYDKSPDNGIYCLVYQVESVDTSNSPSLHDKVSLLVIDKNGVEIFRAEIKAFNWQQGSRAHWLDERSFIFNDFDEKRNKYVSRIYSLETRSYTHVFDYAVQDSYSNQYFLSLNYQRLMALRPDYGYRNLTPLSLAELKSTENDGIWRTNIMSGETSLLISLNSVMSLNPKPEFQGASHKANHVMISPNGEKFIFMHRYLIDGRRVDRLILAEANSGQMTELVNYGMISHCFWLNNEFVFGYMRGPEGRDGYWMVNVETKEMKPFLPDLLKGYGDGHPHVHGDWIVTDTYPDKARMQSLLLINWKTDEVRKLGEFFHPFEYYGESRCDLHPRFSSDGRSIYFDSVFSGKRHLYKMKVF